MPKHRKQFAAVFSVPKRRNYDSLEHAIKANKKMSPESKTKALATIRRKRGGI